MIKRVVSFLAGLAVLGPVIAWAEEVGATYRGIGSIYFTLIGASLIIGVYDALGKQAALIMGPIIVVGLYLLLPAR